MKIISRIENLIKAMSMNEKRYFVIQNQNIDLGIQNKYFILYNLFIHSKKMVEEHQIQNLLAKNQLSLSNISADLGYLYDLLLKALTDFHSKKIMNLKIMEHIAKVEVLFFKGLYDACLHEINKLKRSNELKENPYLMLNLMNWEKKCKGYSKGLLEAIKINQNMSSNIETLDKIKVITDLYYRTYYLKNNVGHLPKNDIHSELNEIIKHPILKENHIYEMTLIFVFIELIYANYYHVFQKYDDELKRLIKVVKLYDANNQFRYENPLDYIAIYSRMINIIKHKNVDEFYQHVLRLRNFKHFINIQKEVVEERIWIFTNMAELDYILLSLDFTNNQNKFQTIYNEINDTKYDIEPHYLMAFHYLLASIFCFIGNYSDALKLVNKILNEFEYKDNPKIFLQTEFLNYIIHFEKKDFDFVLHQMTINRNKYHHNDFNSKIQKKLVLGIYQLCKESNYSGNKNLYQKIIEKYANKKDSLSTRDNNLINYIKLKIEK